MIKTKDYPVEFFYFWITNLNGFGHKKITYILNCLGDITYLYNIVNNLGYESAKKLLTESLAGMARISGEDIEVLLSNKHKEEAKKEYEKIIHSGISVLCIESENYPSRLLDIFDPPYILYYKGSLPKRISVGIVGARSCSEYGRKMAKEIAMNLSLNNIDVISGFARGTDSAAHTGALNAGGKTFGIFGCGVNVCYPPENHFMYQEILEKGGGLISEYPPYTKPAPGLFPLRNRIISGLSDLLIVIEAGDRSGSLITADQALEQNKTVMALPGRVCDRLSLGTNKLIRQGAGIISCMEDIYYELGIECKEKGINNSAINSAIDSGSQIILAKTEKMLYSQLDFSPQSAQTLGEQCNLTASEVARGLAVLELNGLAIERGGCYMRV